MKLNGLFVFAAVAFAILAVGLIVLSAIERGTLPVLLLGVLALCVVAAVLTAFAMRMYERWTEARVKALELQNKFVLEMAKEGYLPSGNKYQPVRQQISAPQAQTKQGVSQIIFNPNALRESAVNLLLFSMRQCGADQNRIASGPECAAAGVNGYSPRTWSKIVHEYLEPHYGVVTQRGAVEFGGGTFVSENYGTVEALYHKVMQEDAVNALPELVR